MILDTEGLHSIFRDKQVDASILGISLLLSSVFVYNNFGVIDEKELNDICAVIELTRWVKLGNAIPFFLWCLRDFMLDYKEYQNSDDYLENVISTKDYEPTSDKYRVRRGFADFFKDRGCMFFVRPVNDEARLRVIEQLNSSELRPEFNTAI